MPGNIYLYQELYNRTLMTSLPLFLKIKALSELEQEPDPAITSDQIAGIKKNIQDALQLLNLNLDIEHEFTNEASSIEFELFTLNEQLKSYYNTYKNAAQHSKENPKTYTKEFDSAYQNYQQAIQYFERSVNQLLANATPSPEKNAKAKKFLDQSVVAANMLCIDFNEKIPLEQQAQHLLSRLEIAQDFLTEADQQNINKKNIAALKEKIKYFQTAKIEAKEVPLKAYTELSSACGASFEALLKIYPDEKSLLISDNVARAEQVANDAQAKLTTTKQGLFLAETESKALDTKNAALQERIKKFEQESKIQERREELEEIKREIQHSRTQYIQAEVKSRGDKHEPEIRNFIDQHIREKILPDISNAENALQAAQAKKLELEEEQRTLAAEISANNKKLTEYRLSFTNLQAIATQASADLQKEQEMLEKWKELDSKIRTAVQNEKAEAPRLRQKTNEIMADKNLLNNFKRISPIRTKFSICFLSIQDPYYSTIFNDYLACESSIKKELEKGEPNRSIISNAIYKILEYQETLKILIAENAWRVESDIATLNREKTEAKGEQKETKQHARKEANRQSWILETINERLQEELFKHTLEKQVDYLNQHLTRITGQQEDLNLESKIKKPLQLGKSQSAVDLKFHGAKLFLKESFITLKNAEAALGKAIAAQKKSKADTSVAENEYSHALKTFDNNYNQACLQIKEYYWKKYQENGHIPTFKYNPSPAKRPSQIAEDKNTPSKFSRFTSSVRNLFKTRSGLQNFDIITAKHTNHTPLPRPASISEEKERKAKDNKH